MLRKQFIFNPLVIIHAWGIPYYRTCGETKLAIVHPQDSNLYLQGMETHPHGKVSNFGG
jgi:hypothetical protein